MSKEKDLTDFIDMEMFMTIVNNASNKRTRVAVIQLATLLLQQSLALEYIVSRLDEGKMLSMEEMRLYLVESSKTLAASITKRIDSDAHEVFLDDALNGYYTDGRIFNA